MDFSMMKIPVLMAIVAAAGCSDRAARGGVDPRISDASRPLVFLTSPTEPPCSYVNDAGEIVGTDVDLARQIADRMGRKLVVEGVAFGEILPRLKTGTADFGIATIIITEARGLDVDFSAPYAIGGACFLYRSDGRKPRMSQLATFRIGVESDSVHDLYICFHGCDPTRFGHLADAVAALESGEVDAVFFDVLGAGEVMETEFLISRAEGIINRRIGADEFVSCMVRLQLLGLAREIGMGHYMGI